MACRKPCRLPVLAVAAQRLDRFEDVTAGRQRRLRPLLTELRFEHSRQRGFRFVGGVTERRPAGQQQADDNGGRPPHGKPERLDQNLAASRRCTPASPTSSTLPSRVGSTHDSVSVCLLPMRSVIGT